MSFNLHVGLWAGISSSERYSVGQCLFYVYLLGKGIWNQNITGLNRRASRKGQLYERRILDGVFLLTSKPSTGSVS